MKALKEVWLIFTFCFSMAALCQQQTLTGHRELFAQHNPALLKGGNYGSVTFLHRSQWEELGPSSNSLFVRYPFGNNRSSFAPDAIGMILQYEEFSFLTRTNFEFLIASTLFEVGDYSVNLGVNGGVNHLSVQTGQLDLEELVDPELADLNGRAVFSNRIGLSLSHELFEWGVSSRVLDFGQLSEYHTTLSIDIPVAHPRYHVQPLLAFRSTRTWDKQLEGQVRVSYNDKVSFTSGFRQHFGFIFQIGVFLNKGKVSYGAELPIEENNRLGLTHEVLASYQFESPASVRHRKDSVIKVKRDSINKARIERLRQRNLQKDSLENSDNDELEIVGEVEENEPDSEVAIVDVEAKKDSEEPQDTELSLEDLDTQPEEDSHFILRRIGFENGLYLLKPSSYKQLDRFYHYVQHHRSLHFEIQGHTDDIGSSENNLKLSELRARTVYNYLVSRGVDPARMNVVGYGEEVPLVPNDSEEHKEMNRRIEVVFIKK